MLQLREKEIFETLKMIKKYNFTVIGGYAANTYTLPRFSVDCDIAVQDKDELDKIGIELKKRGYKKETTGDADIPYAGQFARYEKTIANNFKVSIDMLVKTIFDRQTNSTFSAEWIFQNSKIIPLRGKTIDEELNLKIINIDALIVMKIISCRMTDIRDVFMLMPQAENTEWIKNEIGKRCSIQDRLKKLKSTIRSKEFRDNLQGIYGYIEERIFEKHKREIEKI